MKLHENTSFVDYFQSHSSKLIDASQKKKRWPIRADCQLKSMSVCQGKGENMQAESPESDLRPNGDP